VIQKDLLQRLNILPRKISVQRNGWTALEGRERPVRRNYLAGA
jgi:hypothetical protein